MIRKTMRVGEVRTSIKLEQEFWSYLKDLADERSVRLSRLVNDVAEATPERTNLASTLRTFSLIHAQLRAKSLNQDVEKLRLAGSSVDLSRVLDTCPLPCLLVTPEREVKRVNQAFVAWLNLDPLGVIGKRLDNVMILRGTGMKSLWQRIFEQGAREERFNATYVSPGRVRTAQAVALGLAKQGESSAHDACLVMFETLAGRG